jgi:hypothetical protein
MTTISAPALATGRAFSGVLVLLPDDPPPPLHAASDKVNIMSHNCLDVAFIIELLKVLISCDEQRD